MSCLVMHFPAPSCLIERNISAASLLTVKNHAQRKIALPCSWGKLDLYHQPSKCIQATRSCFILRHILKPKIAIIMVESSLPREPAASSSLKPGAAPALLLTGYLQNAYLVCNFLLSWFSDDGLLFLYSFLFFKNETIGQRASSYEKARWGWYASLWG